MSEKRKGRYDADRGAAVYQKATGGSVGDGLTVAAAMLTALTEGVRQTPPASREAIISRTIDLAFNVAEIVECERGAHVTGLHLSLGPVLDDMIAQYIEQCEATDLAVPVG